MTGLSQAGDQLTLFQPGGGGHIIPTQYYVLPPPPPLRFLDLATALDDMSRANLFLICHLLFELIIKKGRKTESLHF